MTFIKSYKLPSFILKNSICFFPICTLLIYEPSKSCGGFHRGTPVHHPFLDWDFPLKKNIQLLEYPHDELEPLIFLPPIPEPNLAQSHGLHQELIDQDQGYGYRQQHDSASKRWGFPALDGFYNEQSDENG